MSAIGAPPIGVAPWHPWQLVATTFDTLQGTMPLASAGVDTGAADGGGVLAASRGGDGVAAAGETMGARTAFVPPVFIGIGAAGCANEPACATLAVGSVALGTEGEGAACGCGASALHAPIAHTSNTGAARPQR